MKILKRIFSVLLTVIVLLIGGCLLYISLFARETIQTKLTDALGHPVKISSVSYHFPCGLKLNEFRIADMVQIDRVYLQVNLTTVWDQTVRLTQFDLINPVLILEDRDLSWRGEREADGQTDTESGEEQKMAGSTGPKRVYDIGRVNVTNGRLDIVQQEGQSPLKVELTNVRGHFKNVGVPWRARRMPFHFEATAGMNILRSELTQRPAIGKGWIDPRRQRLEGELHLQDPNGADQMSMALLIGDNTLSVKGNLHTDLAAAPEPRTEGEVWDQIARPLVKQLTDGQGILFDTQFTVKDKLDEFRLDTMRIEFKGVAVQPEPAEKKVLPAE